MPAIAPTSNPKAQVPGAAPGITTRSTSTNVSAGYKLSVGTVVNAYGQTVLNPGIGTMLAPLASTIPTPPKPPAPAAAPSGSGSGSPAGGTADGSPSTLLRDVKST